MITEIQVDYLEPGHILTISNHFRHENLNGRDVVFAKKSPAKGYILGHLVIFEKETIRLGKLARFRLTDVVVMPRKWKTELPSVDTEALDGETIEELEA